jgi:hypothetical protein
MQKWIVMQNCILPRGGQLSSRNLKDDDLDVFAGG